MIFSELKNRTISLLTKLITTWEKSEFNQFYTQLLNFDKTFINQIKSEHIDPQTFQKHHNAYLQQVRKLVGATDIGLLFVSLHKLQNDLEKFNEQNPLLSARTNILRDGLQNIWGHLNILMQQPENYAHILAILNQCKTFEDAFVYFKNCDFFLTECEKSLSSNLEKSLEESEFSIYFFSVDQLLIDFNLHLSALQKIYSEVCFLFNVNEQSTPLKVEKIESGTLFSKLIGESKVLDFISWFLKNSIRYLHRTYTNEGKISKIPSNITTLEKLFEFHKKLKELDSDNFKELLDNQADHLNKCMVIITKNAQILLEKETKIKIDNEIIELGDKESNLYIEAIKQIENKDEKR